MAQFAAVVHASAIQIEGFKSFRKAEVVLNDGVNLLLGANGAGKSNFIAFFRFLSRLVERQLYLHTGEGGGAAAFLHKGPPSVNELAARVHVGNNDYSFRLRRTEHEDRFVFLEEKAAWYQHARSLALPGANESALKDLDAPIPRHTYEYLSDIRVFHFHDTSPDAPVMGSEHRDNSDRLAGDARNLAAVLLQLRASDEAVYDHICATIRLIAPFFDDFVLKPDSTGRVALRWRQTALSEDTFGPSAFSDGTLRFVCLATLLNLPEAFLPKLVLLDEPELGLHPHAIHVLADLLKSAGARTQLVVATQSSFLVDHFSPENVVVVEREGSGSTLRRLRGEEWESWLERYTLGEIWRKNLIGGTPL